MTERDDQDRDCIVRRDGDRIIIDASVEYLRDMRIALQPCPCRSNKSRATAERRSDFLTRIRAALFA